MSSFSSPFVRGLAALLGLCAATAHAGWFGSGSWPELTPEELALSAPRIDPEASAEILLREIEINDRRDDQTVYEYFRRVKLFDQRGVEEFKTVELEGWFDARISKVQARVIYPDGRIEELERDAVHSQETFRLGRFRAKTASFALPSLEPGCIVDYRWRITKDGMAYGDRIYSQVGYPTHRFFFRMEFYSDFRSGWTTSGFPSDLFVTHRGGQELVLTDLPAAPDDDFLPPRNVTQPWITVYYIFNDNKDWVPAFWRDFARNLHNNGSDFQGNRRLIKDKAKALTAGVTEDRERLRRLYNFCQAEITNIYSDAAGLSNREIEELKSIKKAEDALRRGYASRYYINALFGSLAEALDYEVQWAAVADRTFSTFDPSMVYYQALPDRIVAVRSPGEEKWTFHDPGSRNVAFGHLAWENEALQALIGDRKEPAMFYTPSLPADKSVLRREATFELQEDGSLTGSATFTYTGHLANIQKNIMDGLTPTEREETLTEELAESLPNVEVENVEFEGVLTPEAPMIVRFELTVPAFADRTSQRIFLEPAVFAKGNSRLFGEEERTFDVSFSYRWTEEDDLRIRLPKGYEIEEGASPQALGEHQVISHLVNLAYDKGDHALLYKRHYKVNTLILPARAYDAVRASYDAIFQADQHLLNLRLAETAAKTETAAEPAPSPDAEPTAQAAPTTTPPAA
ncbi:MAG: DUF3857 domain-containing protein [Verrucomicrobiota bacterium]